MMKFKEIEKLTVLNSKTIQMYKDIFYDRIAKKNLITDNGT